MTQERMITLSEPWYDDNETSRVREAFSGRIGGDGPFCKRVETRLARLLGARHVLLTTSCTHALELSLMALGVGPGDEVVCPSFTFVSTANAVLRVGARPVFADIEDVALGLDPADVARRLTERTRAIIPMHYAGQPCAMDEILELARKRGVFVVEDAAQALGATYRGQSAGALGDAGCFSFHETKNVTCGEGGALTVADDVVAARAEIMREKGTNRKAFLRGDVDKYTWISEGSSYVLSDILAAVLDAQLDKLDEIHRRRSRASSLYRAGLDDWAKRGGVRLPSALDDRRGNDHVFFLLFPDERVRDRLQARLRSQGILTAFHYVPLHTSAFGRAFLLHDQALPVTERVASALLRLPLHPLLEDD
ncbi:MAG: dTDP-4-amino-4,6-dideoxygalactose transaminase, partial [Vicinamibacteria bacterium]|nr:dTDP-4-amino-4,6-dideoxygalactose transaminase [Vicinamibacteria bacterium]